MANSDLKLYRRRYIPNETIYLKDDEVLLADSELIVTKWDVLNPRKDISRGISAYYLMKNFKISKIFDEDNNLVYWYCDIIHTEQPDKSTYIFHDLLVDIIVHPNGLVRVVDLDELADIMEQPDGLSNEMIIKAMRATNHLLTLIYDGQFKHLAKIIEDYE